MSVGKEIQNDDFFLKGDLGNVNGKPITKVEFRQRSVTLTVSPKNTRIFETTQPEDKNDLGNGWSKGCKDFKQIWQDTEDVDCEIIHQKQIDHGKQ